jgi:RNA polymerase sigma factor (sigma-70 family)
VAVKVAPVFWHFMPEETGMDYPDLVRRASGGEAIAFVELTRRFQHAAFGSALAHVGDFHQAEDVVQEAFLAAWSALPRLGDAAAFPGWLRTIVRRQAFRLLRQRELPTTTLTAAEEVPSEEPAADQRFEQRQQAQAVLATLSTLPAHLREPALLFFIHECSHQDVATFLGLTVATVNNRLHAARTELKRRMLTMIIENLHGQALPDDFANRIGRLIEARGNVVDALFDPGATPDILTELSISDEVNRRAVNLHVVQRPAPGIVRGLAKSPAAGLPRGSTVLSSGRHTQTPFDAVEFAEFVASLTEAPAAQPSRLLETGIKVIDVMCPLVAGGTLAIAGDPGGGSTVVMEELVRRLSAGPDRLTILLMIPQPSAHVWPRARAPGFSLAETLKKDGYSEGTVGAVQTLFFLAPEAGWTQEQLSALAPADTVIRLSLERARAKVYPPVDVLTSRSRLLETKTADREHVTTANRVRKALASLWSEKRPRSAAARLARERALKLQNYFTQPFYCAEPWTKRSGATVARTETLRTCTEILDGAHDDVPVEQFYFRGGIGDIRHGNGPGSAIGPVRR